MRGSKAGISLHTCPLQRAAARAALAVVAGIIVMLLVLPRSLAAQDLTLERYERWRLYPPPDEAAASITALLLLFVRNDSDRLIKHWRALLVVRDSSDRELFRLPIERDSADLAPRTRARVELTFSDRPGVVDEPFDHLLANDTANLRVQFDEVRIVESGAVAYVAAGAPLCRSGQALARLHDAAPGAAAGPDCQWTQERLIVEFLRPDGALGAVVRPRLMTQPAWVFTRDLERS